MSSNFTAAIVERFWDSKICDYNSFARFGRADNPEDAIQNAELFGIQQIFPLVSARTTSLRSMGHYARLLFPQVRREYYEMPVNTSYKVARRYDAQIRTER
jgi:hypothetical protein